MSDPKMGIPQNEELFNHVIKLANTEASKGKAQIAESKEATLNRELEAILHRSKIIVKKEINPLDYLKFIISNYGWTNWAQKLLKCI